ncbi:Hypothetical predicted protein [Mytilus galloprovincialis]|uniref:Ig-like domain-containing protein n=1 Tax=Mytilus galloprovincialis TaxID=29158 RepID=A0A8B6GTC8_MYTGA|nr:Hypothetical predicted protein [Mytilus galloprovincialis]
MLKGIQPDTTEKKPIQVSVLAPEQLTMKLITQKEKIIKGSSHTIKYEISGIPKPNKIWWMKDGLERKGEDSASLVFDEFQPTDEGCYICYAKNAAGTSESDPLSLICLEKPTVLLHCEELQIKKGSNHIIKCSVSGKPIPNTLSWKKRIHKDNTTVDLTEAKYAGGTVDSPSLTIKDFDMSDEGTYTCQAINEAGEGCSEELLLLCIEKLTLKLTTQKEKIIKGSSHTIECKISGIPKPNQIWWMKDNVKRKGRDLASLVFKEFQLSDEGCYICYATNAAGTSESGELTLECIGW